MPARNPDTLGRFWVKVDVRGADDCWLWRSDVDTYGRFNVLRGGRLIGAHVFSWILANCADVPPGLLVLHSCDNKRCVNPRHLSLGTYSRNGKEAVERGLLDPARARAAIRRRAHCQRSHELSDDNLYVSGSHRRCKKCHAEREGRYRQRRQDQRENDMRNNPNDHRLEWA